MSELILLTDPVQPALPYAVDIEISAIAEENEDDQERYIAQAVTELHDVAALGGLINKQFVVDAKTALLIPKDARDFDDVDAQPIDKTSSRVGLSTISLYIEKSVDRRRGLCI